MKTSRMAVFHGPGQPLTLETTDLPVLQSGEILVRNEYVTLCRSDLNTYAGKRTEKTPTILGHEVVGHITELAPDAPTRDARGMELRLGDRVTWAIYAANPDSAMARRGLPQKAPDLFKYGHERLEPGRTWHGGLAEYCVLRRHTPIVRITAPIPLPVTALINCSIATVAGSLRLAGPVLGANVLVAGAGMLGIVACAMCRCAGARKIIALDISDERLATATRFGTDITFNLQSGSVPSRETLVAALAGESVTVAFDYSGAPAAMETVLALLGIGGVAVFVGATFPAPPLQINAEQLVRNVHTLKGLHNYNADDLCAAVEFIERHYHQFPFESLILDKFCLDTINTAFSQALLSPAHRVGVRIW